MGVRILELIETDLERIGAGTEKSPTRRLTQFWSKTGGLIIQHDPCARQLTPEVFDQIISEYEIPKDPVMAGEAKHLLVWLRKRLF